VPHSFQMRILLDEDLPRRLGALLVGHEASTVQRSGWSGIKNGKLLALAVGKFDVFLTMDGNLEFQQNLTTLPIAVLVVEAASNRMEHLVPVVPNILKELNHLPPKSLRRVGA
jgi:predicted nuclease of predicted toxin-antitoxin system